MAPLFAELPLFTSVYRVARQKETTRCHFLLRQEQNRTISSQTGFRVSPVEEIRGNATVVVVKAHEPRNKRVFSLIHKPTDHPFKRADFQLPKNIPARAFTPTPDFPASWHQS
jgi:hypothetical protein